MMLYSPVRKAHTFFYCGLKKKINFLGMRKDTLHTTHESPKLIYCL